MVQLTYSGQGHQSCLRCRNPSRFRSGAHARIRPLFFSGGRRPPPREFRSPISSDRAKKAAISAQNFCQGRLFVVAQNEHEKTIWIVIRRHVCTLIPLCNSRSHLRGLLIWHRVPVIEPKSRHSAQNFCQGRLFVVAQNEHEKTIWIVIPAARMHPDTIVQFAFAPSWPPDLAIALPLASSERSSLA